MSHKVSLVFAEETRYFIQFYQSPITIKTTNTTFIPKYTTIFAAEMKQTNVVYMKKSIFFAPILALTSVFLFFGCVDSDKNLYDDSFEMPNPMGEGFAAPDGFDWNMMKNIQVSVDVNDKHEGNFSYIIEIYNANPILSKKARLLSKGAAKKGECFRSEISVEKSLKTIYIKEYTPTGLSTVRAADISTGDMIYCSFKTISPAAKSVSATRGLSTVKDPGADDTSLFPKECPANIKEFKDDHSWVEGGSYRVTSATKRINLGGKKKIKLYVTENITLSDELYLTQGSCLYILPGKRVSMPPSRNNGQNDCLISIGEGAVLTVSGMIQIDSNYKLYNLGTIEAVNLSCTNASVFYNAGVATIENELSGQNSGSTLVNAGVMKAGNISIQGNSHMSNRDAGEVKVGGKTTLNCSGGSWENDGKWTTNKMDISAWNDFCYNKCLLIVEEKFEMKETHLIVDGGAYVECKELYMNNSKVELGGKSLFKVTGKAEYGYQTKEKGFKGTGSEKALLVMKKAVAQHPNATDMIHYSGNLQIICSDHPHAEIDPWNIRWTLTRGAEWAEEGSNTVAIPATKCNKGQNGGTETAPTEPDFPIEMEDNHEYAYIFEDQWPLYGDYDMNDIVMAIKQRKLSTNHKNKLTRFELTIDLCAVGATKVIGAAIMFDQVKATDIKTPVTFTGDQTPQNFNLNNLNIENGQEQLVIPLFDDAHLALGSNRHEAINTVSGSSNNTKNRTDFGFIIDFDKNNTLSADAFNINKLNIFIIVGGNKDKRREVHVIGYRPTQLADTYHFGGNNDDSSFASQRYYISKENLAWGIMVPTQFKWPLEYTNIKTAYPKFEKWVTSGGKEEEKWWNDFDTDRVFQTNKN